MCISLALHILSAAAQVEAHSLPSHMITRATIVLVQGGFVSAGSSSWAGTFEVLSQGAHSHSTVVANGVNSDLRVLTEGLRGMP